MFVQNLRKPSIKLLNDPEVPTSDAPLLGSRDVLMVEVEDDWHFDIITYIIEHRVPREKAEREKVTRCNTNYIIIGTKLYRRSASKSVLMKCILAYEGLRPLKKIPAVNAATMLPPPSWWGKPSGRASTSLPLWPTLRSNNVKGAISSPSSSTHRLRP
jgi:hypothetical protein